MKKLHFPGLFALIALLLLSTCSNPAGGKNVEEGTFTINLGAFSRSVDYPPDDSPMGPNPSGPLLAELKFEVIFTDVVSSTEKTFTFASGQTASGKIAVGTYSVTMKVRFQLDNSLYAQGVALLNPVEIKSGANTNITIQVYDPEDALPPLISVQPASTDYDLTDTPSALTVTAASIEGGTLSYQWYSSPTDTNDSAAPGVVPVGTDSPSYTPVFTPPMVMGPMFYFVKITNTYAGGGGNPTNTVASNTAKVLLDTAPVIVADGSTETGYLDLQTALDLINTTAGTYIVKIRENQNLAPFSFAYNLLTRDVTLIAEPPGSTVTVQLSSNGNLFGLTSFVTLTLDAGITLRGRNAADNGTDNTGWMVAIPVGKFIMKNGAVITRNSTATIGSGVRNQGGTFIMEGGEISWNTALDGAGVYLDSGIVVTFTMENGIITRNSAIGGNGGGGVFVRSGAVFTMEDGEISWNSSESTSGGGGGVYTQGTFIMEGGEISRNTAARSVSTADGGGVYIPSSGAFTMEGGKITWNTANRGGGVHVRSGAVFTMEDGEISRNTAYLEGGGVEVYGGSFTKAPAGGSTTSGTITGWGDDPVNGNVVLDAFDLPTPNQGHAVYMYTSRMRDKTVGPLETLDSAQSGAAGGWVDP